MSDNDGFDLINEREVARMLGLSTQSIRRRRYHNKPPIYVKIGKSVRYCKQDVVDFIKESRIENSEDA